MATRSSIPAEITRTEETGRLQSMGSQRVGHDLWTKRTIIIAGRGGPALEEVGSHSLASPQRRAQSGNSSIHSFLPRGDNEPQEAWGGVTSKVTKRDRAGTQESWPLRTPQNRGCSTPLRVNGWACTAWQATAHEG